MAFRAEAFLGASFAPRTKGIRLPDLGDWFDGEPVWTVRGLTALEMARCHEAASGRQNAAALLEALTANNKLPKVQEIRRALGLEDEVPQEHAKRLEQLSIGSVDPPCPYELAVMLSERFPVEFYQLTNEITLLTGQGQDPGKSPPSGSETTSKEA